MAPADAHPSQTGGGGEHSTFGAVAPIGGQQDRHIDPRPAAASGSGQGGGAHDVAPLAPVAPLVHCSWMTGQTQPKIAGRPRIVGCVQPVPVTPVIPLEPVEPLAGHGLHTTDEIPPRRPESRAMLVGGPGHGRQSSQATRTEELTIPLAPDRQGEGWHQGSGKTRASGISVEPVEPLEPVVVPAEPVAPPGGQGLHIEIVGIEMVEPVEPVVTPRGHGLQKTVVGMDIVEPVEPVASPGGHGLHRTRRTIRRQRRRIGCPA